MTRLLLLSGAVGAGKTSLARSLSDRYGAQIVRSRDLIATHMQSTQRLRRDFQDAGDALDVQTGGGWLAQALLAIEFTETLIMIDAVRRIEQIDEIRKGFPRFVIKHVHLRAPYPILVERDCRCFLCATALATLVSPRRRAGSQNSE